MPHDNRNNNIQFIAFCSGNGTTAQYLASQIGVHNIAIVVCDTPGAGILDWARQNNKPVHVRGVDENIGLFYADFNTSFNRLKATQPHARFVGYGLGFTGLVPSSILDIPGFVMLNNHPGSVKINTHGKGMYGDAPYQQTLDNIDEYGGEIAGFHGVTIHLMNEHFDKGNIVMEVLFRLNPESLPDLKKLKILTMALEKIMTVKFAKLILQAQDVDVFFKKFDGNFYFKPNLGQMLTDIHMRQQMFDLQGCSLESLVSCLARYEKRGASEYYSHRFITANMVKPMRIELGLEYAREVVSEMRPRLNIPSVWINGIH
jgi:phosphoribosylglycinamide formyltransferase 1